MLRRAGFASGGIAIFGEVGSDSLGDDGFIQLGHGARLHTDCGILPANLWNGDGPLE